MDKKSVEDLIARIKSHDDKVRGEAWQNASGAGAGAVAPLAEAMTDAHMEVARAAKRALWKIVRHVGRPGASPEKVSVVKELVPLLGKSRARAVRVEAAWMLSEIGDDEAAAALAALLRDKDVREDARLALQRIPGEKSLALLKKAAGAADLADFRGNLVSSLRARGVEVPGVPCQKLVPTKKTEVKPVGR